MLTLITAPNEEPVTVAEAKLNCRVDGTAEDTLFDIWIAAARGQVEAYTNRALCTQVWEQRFDAFPASDAFVELPKAPLQSVQQVSYYDATGTLVAATLADFDVNAPAGPRAMPGSVGPAPDKSWPADVQSRPNAARIRFVAGYGAATAVPKELKEAIHLLVADMYANREAQVERALIANPRVKDILDPFRVLYV
jgi:uncharacterized phiE125 gp8 family phage protein